MELNFDEFPIPTYEEWYKTAVAALKGASFEKVLQTETYEGLTLQPIYRREDAQQLAHINTLPGSPPYVRGTHASPRWHIAQELRCSTPKATNEALRHDLANGQTAINLVLDTPTRQGLDPDQTNAHEVGNDGISIATVDDFAVMLNGIDLSRYPIFVQAGGFPLPVAALFIAYLRRSNQNPAQIPGCIAYDPLGTLAQQGTLPLPLAAAYNEMARLTAWAVDNAPVFNTISVDSTPYHSSGSNAVQELALTLATGTEYLREMLHRDLTIDAAANHIQFNFAIGSNFFMEIAKFRAARMLWSQVVEAFGGSQESQKLKLHTRTGTTNKTSLDPYTNMLRATSEAMAGAIGGSDSMHIAPFDEIIRQPDEFSRRIARNQQIILQAESNFTKTIDPAGGSWYIEILTDWLAREAWQQFQQIEAAGGMFAALNAGIPQRQIAEVAEKRAAKLAHRKDVLVGTNMYPDTADMPPTPQDDELYHERANQIETYRAQAGFTPPEQLNSLDHAIEAAQSGATLNQLTRLLRQSANDGPAITPLTRYTGAEMFASLRHAAKAFEQRTGIKPRIFLANIGPLHQHKARADFTTSFFEVGGFEILNNAGYATPQEAAVAALDSHAPVVVVCSTDDTYPDIVPPLVREIKSQKPETLVILAGYPRDQIEQHQAAGIDEFIHIRANCYEMNRKLQQLIGVSDDG